MKMINQKHNQKLIILVVSDTLWYCGHILTGVAIVANHYQFRYGVVCVFIGQFITMISRPIGRIKCADKPPPLPIPEAFTMIEV